MFPRLWILTVIAEQYALEKIAEENSPATDGEERSIYNCDEDAHDE